VVGFVPTAEQLPAVALRDGVTVFDQRRRLVDLVREHRISEIIVAVREQRGGGVPMDQLLDCRIGGVPIMDLAGFYERAKAEVPVDSLKTSWLVYGDGFVQGRLRQASKRVFDVVSSAVLLTLASPVMVLTALAIRLDSPGPILYRQERVGLAGKGFSCIKFRSMRTDAEKDGVARWATKNDSRITRVGAFIRKTRIDELPQLFSVLHGEMSMVGPRPERPSFVAQLREQIPYYDLRHTVKPGLTGWAQVRYAYGASLEDARKKHQFDLYYVKNNSVLLDLQVLIETVSVVLFREGAH
jgi:sugar transferase (PEP-CTERM system associated)